MPETPFVYWSRLGCTLGTCGGPVLRSGGERHNSPCEGADDGSRRRAVDEAAKDTHSCHRGLRAVGPGTGDPLFGSSRPAHPLPRGPRRRRRLTRGLGAHRRHRRGSRNWGRWSRGDHGHHGHHGINRRGRRGRGQRGGRSPEHRASGLGRLIRVLRPHQPGRDRLLPLLRSQNHLPNDRSLPSGSLPEGARTRSRKDAISEGRDPEIHVPKDTISQTKTPLFIY